MRRGGQPAAAYTWRVAAGGVLVVMDLNRDGWRSVTDDAAGVVSDLAKLRPDLLAHIPMVLYRDSLGVWNALCTDEKGAFTNCKHMGALSEAEAAALVLALHD